MERIDVKALVVPVEIFVLKRSFEYAPLCIIRGDNSVRDVFFLQVLSEMHDRIDFFLVLKTASRRG